MATVPGAAPKPVTYLSLVEACDEYVQLRITTEPCKVLSDFEQLSA